jgi:hypothetical protein
MALAEVSTRFLIPRHPLQVVKDVLGLGEPRKPWDFTGQAWVIQTMPSGYGWGLRLDARPLGRVSDPQIAVHGFDR